MTRFFIHLFTIIFLLVAGSVVAIADPIDNTVCPVIKNSDADDELGTLRRSIAYFNRDTTSRMCTEKIKFPAFQEYDIVAEDTYTISMPTDTDFNGDGWKLIISGYWADVVIDGTNLDHDQCVFAVYNNNVRISDITIRVWDKDFAICNYGSNNDFSRVKIIQTKPTYHQANPVW